ncbi:MAG: hypothetical protein K6G23_00765 [Lachnospiraceae bacterium]|nr:hypothetical protein [Lachnospiraceae bacterium]
MILGMTFYQICWYFVLYSFIGWCVEVVFHAVTLGKVINRGFLNGPVCPVYGFGMLSLFGLAGLTVQDGSIMEMPNWLIFVGGLILATIVELIAGWTLDRIFHARWWDYHDRPYNLNGYICLEFSLIWGLGALIVVRVVHPIVEKSSVELIPEKIGWWILLVLYMAYIADVIVSVAIMNGFNKRLKELDRLRSSMRIVSDSMTEQIATGAIKTAQVIGETKVQSALARAELRDAVAESKAQMLDAVAESKAQMLDAVTESRAQMAARSGELSDAAHERYEQLRRELEEKMTQTKNYMRKTRFFGAGRLLRAFPNVTHRDYMEALQELRSRLSGDSGAQEKSGSQEKTHEPTKKE